MTGPFELTAEDPELRCRVLPSGGVPPRPGPADSSGPTLIYLPGLHGDWTLLGPFRAALGGRGRLVEFTYPRRTDWRLPDYAEAISAELSRLGIADAWLLGESFSSQVVWALVEHWRRIGVAPPIQGIVLVGGFVRHPLPWGVSWARFLSAALPMSAIAQACRAYGRMARRRTQAAGLDRSEIDLFVARRCRPVDRSALTSRYPLIRQADFRPVARQVRWPVFLLTGGVDPIVPWPAVLRWLRRHCPGFAGHRIVWRAGHNVLLDAPAVSADQILAWTKSGGGTSKKGEPERRFLDPDDAQRRSDMEL